MFGERAWGGKESIAWNPKVNTPLKKEEGKEEEGEEEEEGRKGRQEENKKPCKDHLKRPAVRVRSTSDKGILGITC